MWIQRPVSDLHASPRRRAELAKSCARRRAGVASMASQGASHTPRAAAQQFHQRVDAVGDDSRWTLTRPARDARATPLKTVHTRKRAELKKLRPRRRRRHCSFSSSYPSRRGSRLPFRGHVPNPYASLTFDPRALTTSRNLRWTFKGHATPCRRTAFHPRWSILQP